MSVGTVPAVLWQVRSSSQCRVAAVQQTADFLHHSFFQTRRQPAVNPGVSFLTGYQSAYVVCVLGEVCCTLNGVFRFVNRYFKCTDKAFAGVIVGGVVERFQAGELLDKLLVSLLLQFFPELRIRRYFRQ